MSDNLMRYRMFWNTQSGIADIVDFCEGREVVSITPGYNDSEVAQHEYGTGYYITVAWFDRKSFECCCPCRPREELCGCRKCMSL